MENFFRKNRDQEGVTLISLVITTVIIIILASASINAVLGDGGLINQARQVSAAVKNSTIAEEESMNTLMAEYANIMAEEPDIPIP